MQDKTKNKCMQVQNARGEEGDRGRGDQQASSLIIKKSHKAENKNFVKLYLFIFECSFDLSWLDTSCNTLQLH